MPVENTAVSGISVVLQLAKVSQSVPGADDFQRWVEETLRYRGVANAEVCVRIVSGEESADLNRRYRKRTGPTNVLAFPSRAEHIESRMLGDLVICDSLVVGEAAEQGKRPIDHWAHLCIHGVLHLLGYDHVDSTERHTMEAIEIGLLASWGIANPYV